MGIFADRRDRKRHAYEAQAQLAVWHQKDKAFDYTRKDLEQRPYDDLIIPKFVDRVELVPLFAADGLKPIFGTAGIGGGGARLIRTDGSMEYIMMWRFSECSQMVVSDDDLMISFKTGRDDGTEVVGLRGRDDELVWATRLYWECSKNGPAAALAALDAMQIEHHRNRPSGYRAPG